MAYVDDLYYGLMNNTTLNNIVEESYGDKVYFYLYPREFSNISLDKDKYKYFYKNIDLDELIDVKVSESYADDDKYNFKITNNSKLIPYPSVRYLGSMNNLHISSKFKIMEYLDSIDRNIFIKDAMLEFKLNSLEENTDVLTTVKSKLLKINGLSAYYNAVDNIYDSTRISLGHTAEQYAHGFEIFKENYKSNDQYLITAERNYGQYVYAYTGRSTGDKLPHIDTFSMDTYGDMIISIYLILLCNDSRGNVPTYNYALYIDYKDYGYRILETQELARFIPLPAGQQNFILELCDQGHSNSIGTFLRLNVMIPKEAVDHALEVNGEAPTGIPTVIYLPTSVYTLNSTYNDLLYSYFGGNDFYMLQHYISQFSKTLTKEGKSDYEILETEALLPIHMIGYNPLVTIYMDGGNYNGIYHNYNYSMIIKGKNLAYAVPVPDQISILDPFLHIFDVNDATANSLISSMMTPTGPSVAWESSAGATGIISHNMILPRFTLNKTTTATDSPNSIFRYNPTLMVKTNLEHSLLSNIKYTELSLQKIPNAYFVQDAGYKPSITLKKSDSYTQHLFNLSYHLRVSLAGEVINYDSNATNSYNNASAYKINHLNSHLTLSDVDNAEFLSQKDCPGGYGQTRGNGIFMMNIIV